MKYCYITFRSVTFSQKGEGVLRRAGLSCSVQRTPRWMEEQGCGYSLRIRQTDAPKAVAFLRQAGVSYRKIYLQRDTGALEEMDL